MFSFKDFIPNLLTHKELKVLKKRFQIVDLLKTNLTYREISQQIGISTTTVVRLNQRLKVRTRQKLKHLPARNAVHNVAGGDGQERKLPWRIGTEDL